MATTERRILLVEDEPTLQRILGSVLGDAGHAVESVGTAEAALTRLNETSSAPIDLVLSDKNLPGMSGLDLLSKVRTLEVDHPVDRAFVLVTGYPSRDSAMTLLEHGANGYLVKPFRSLIHATETITHIMGAPLAAFRVATTLAQAAVATLMRDDSEPFLPNTRISILLDDEGHRETLTARAIARGAEVVALDTLGREGNTDPELLVAGRVEDLEAFAKQAPRTGLVLADGGASFRTLQTLIHAGGGAVLDPTLVPGVA